MSKRKKDRGLDTLLELDGEILVVDSSEKHWVKFIVKQVDPSPERPHGLSYSLTLHDETGTRLVGFDNAHPSIVQVQGRGGEGQNYTITSTGYGQSSPMTTRIPPRC